MPPLENLLSFVFSQIPWEGVVIGLLALFIGVPLLSILVMAIFGLTADFKFVEVRVRGGTLRGTIASAVARVMVRDTATIQLPLEVVLDKTGLFGRPAPLFGKASVQDVECWVYMDDEHVSTVTEAHTTVIRSRSSQLVLPVNVDVHLPQGVIRAYRDYRAKKRRAAEVKLSVRGHVILRHWWINRRIPVRLTRYVVVGDAVPRLASLRWRAVAGAGEVWGRGEVSVRLENPYEHEELEGPVRFELRRRRRVLPDVLLAVHEARGVKIRPKRDRSFVLHTSFADVEGSGSTEGVPDTPGGEEPRPVRDPGPGLPESPWSADTIVGVGGEDGTQEQAVHVVLRVYWDEQELTPDEVRVLGVPGAKHGPLLSTGIDGGRKQRKEAVARLELQGVSHKSS